MNRSIKLLFIAIVLIGAAVMAFLTREWLKRRATAPPATPSSAPLPPGAEDTANRIILGELAQQNLGLSAQSMSTETYWKTISVVGMVVDRPGVSDREVVAPAIGVINTILRVPGDSVQPGELLFMLRLTSESLHNTQAELFKATENIKIAQARLERLRAIGDAIGAAQLIDVENEITRQEAAAKALRHELRVHGFSPGDVEAVETGSLLRELPILAPAEDTAARPARASGNGPTQDAGQASPSALEMQRLDVEVGQQVQAGQALCLLSNHQVLAVEGRAFREETTLLEKSIKERWPVTIDFQEADSSDWPLLDQTFRISHLANVIDPATRTFAFLIPVANQARQVSNPDGTQVLWRFRPGQKVRIEVRVEALDDVFVLPADAVAREGADAYVFTQNVNSFTRVPVHVVYHDRQHVVVANDGALPTYAKEGQQRTIAAVVQNAAPQLNRMLKAGSNAIPKGFHVHADGSLHKNEDEGK